MEQSYQGRAKQFLPYAALVGFEETVAKKRKAPAKRRELSEDEAERLSKKISGLKKGDAVRLTYYQDGEYRQVLGTVTQVDFTFMHLVVNKTKILFSDLYNLEICK